MNQIEVTVTGTIRRPDGSLDSEIVDGTNKGSRLTQTFAPEGGDATRSRKAASTSRCAATGLRPEPEAKARAPMRRVRDREFSG